jgi:hypothetical protein
MSEVRALRALRWCYIAFIAYASAQTYFGAHHDLHAVVLSSVEFSAALAFLIEPFEVIACVVLLLVFGVAAVITLAETEVPVRFFYFAATAAYIVFAHRRLNACASQPSER